MVLLDEGGADGGGDHLALALGRMGATEGGWRPARKRENCLPPAAAVENRGNPRKPAGSGGVGKNHKFSSLYPIWGMRRPSALVDNAAMKFVNLPGTHSNAGFLRYPER